MAIRLKKREIKLSEGYAIIRELSPFDNIQLAEIFKDKLEDVATLNNAIVGMSISEIISPDYDKYKEEEYLLPDPVNPHNYIEDPDDKTKKILDPEFPDNFILDKTKSVSTTYSPVITSEKDLYERMSMGLADWTTIAYHSLKMNEPNPNLLKK